IKKGTDEVIVEIDPRYFRPTDVDFLLGDPTKAKQKLGWSPKVKFEELVKIMSDYDLKLAQYQLYKNGYKNGK
ncbi:GDP-mannose 4,6-dehydratase, partial [Athalassotoga sp.]|uniref:GDP-mannose 4,6-dehydratase n=1 Tax=Athalassotoga sp. TaxID=2022597 RepID=UPI003D029CA8